MMLKSKQAALFSQLTCKIYYLQSKHRLPINIPAARQIYEAAIKSLSIIREDGIRFDTMDITILGRLVMISTHQILSIIMTQRGSLCFR